MRESVAGILYRDFSVLIARRLMQGSMAGRWEFPGGKVEEGESREEALIREFDEEFASLICVGDCLAHSSFTHNEKKRTLFAYRVFTDENPFEWLLQEHLELRWVSLDEITELSFVDSDLLLLPELFEWQKSL